MSGMDKVRAAIWRVPVGLQLSGLYTLLFIVSLSVLGWVLYSQLDRFLVQNTAERLERTSSSLLTHGVDFDRDGPGRRPEGAGGTGSGNSPAWQFGDAAQKRYFSMVVRELS